MFWNRQKKVKVNQVDTLLTAVNFRGGLSALLERAKSTGRSIEKEVARILAQADMDEETANAIFEAAMVQLEEDRLDANHKQEDVDGIKEALKAFGKK